MKLALALALLPGVSAQQQHMLGAQGPTVALERFAGFDPGAGPLSDAVLPAAASTLSHKFSPDGNVAGEPSKLDDIVAARPIVEGEASEDARRRAADKSQKKKKTSAASSCSGLSKRECKTTDGCKYKKKKDKCIAK